MKEETPNFYNENFNESLKIFIEKSKSLKLQNLEKIKNLSNLRAVVFFGSSASGKTSLVNSIREMEKDIPIQIPRRLITRSHRMNDDLNENAHVTKEEFEQLATGNSTLDPDSYNSWKRALHASEGIINWEREMEGGRKEKYGFEKSLYYLDERIKILSGNNDLARHKDEIPYPDEQVLWIGVYAPKETRAQRIEKRSPDMLEQEKVYRLGDEGKDVIPLADIVINNYGDNENFSKEEIKDLIKNLIKIKYQNLKNK